MRVDADVLDAWAALQGSTAHVGQAVQIEEQRGASEQSSVDASGVAEIVAAELATAELKSRITVLEVRLEASEARAVAAELNRDHWRAHAETSMADLERQRAV